MSAIVVLASFAQAFNTYTAISILWQYAVKKERLKVVFSLIYLILQISIWILMLA
jgi:hypothetical protein